MRRKNSLFYKILAVMIATSLIPALFVSLRILYLNRELQIVGGKDWSIPPQAIEQISHTLMTTSVTYLIYSLISISIISLFISGGLIQPLRRIEQAIINFLSSGKTGGEKNEYTAIVIQSDSDELEHISRLLQHMMNDLRQLQHDLELQVHERTRELEYLTRRQQAAASVAQALSSIRDLDSLLTQVTQLISENFGYYHVGIFLLDDKKEFVLLRASNSPGGHQMLARGYKLSIADTSIVGHVAYTSQPRVALRVGADAIHLKNPYLPETRSEMALPLRTGSVEQQDKADNETDGPTTQERLWGVLDVQSQIEDAFSREDIEVLQILANQVAIAIENAHLFIENQEAVTKLQNALLTSQKLYGEITGEAWRKLLQMRPQDGYIADRASEKAKASSEGLVSTAPTSGEWSQDMKLVAKSGKSLLSNPHTLIIPIQMRDIMVGVLRLNKPDNAAPWSRNEIELIKKLTEQLSVALESARLYDESRRRAARERLTGEIIAKLRASNDPQVILKTAMDELKQALQTTQARVVMYKLGGEEAVE